VFEFDSDRKRQSVVIREGNSYVLYVKGADSSIMCNLDKNNEPIHKMDLEVSLLRFSRLGYRTLVFGRRVLTIDEFHSMKEEYSKVVSSGDREAGMHILACKWEDKLELLGATAVEDKL